MKPLSIIYRNYTATLYNVDCLKIQDWNGKVVASEVHWDGAKDGHAISALKKAIDDYIRLAPFFLQWEPEEMEVSL